MENNKKEVWNYDVYDQNSLFYLLMTGYSLPLKSLYSKTHPMQIRVITWYGVSGTIYNLIVLKMKSCICHGQEEGMRQTY